MGSITRSERLAKYNRLLEIEKDDCLPFARSSIPDVDGSAAIRGAAIARYPLHIPVEVVVDGQFFTRMNIANTHI